MVSGVIALALLAAGPQGPEAPMRYKMDVSLKQDVDLSPMGQPNQVSAVDGSVFFTLTMSDSADGQLAHAVIDSMKIGEASGQMAAVMSQAAADAVAGQFVHAYIKDGKVEGNAVPSVSGPGNEIMNLAMPVMTSLFPGVKASQQTWSDTTTNSTSTPDGNSMNSQAIIAWKVVGMDGSQIKLSATGKGTVSGTQNGQDISGEVSNDWVVTTQIGGPASYSKMTSSQNLIIIVMQAPEPINVAVSTVATVMALP